jgi:hypothetical protein
MSFSTQAIQQANNITKLEVSARHVYRLPNFDYSIGPSTTFTLAQTCARPHSGLVVTSAVMH